VPEKEEDEWLTVAEAAKRLKVSERQVRHIIARPENAAKTRQTTRQTKTGERTAAVLSAAFIEELLSRILPQENTLFEGPVNTANNAERNEVPRSKIDGMNTAIDTSAAFVPRYLHDQMVTLLEQQRKDEVDRHQAEVGRLNSALERAQTLHLGTMTELQTLRERMRELESQNSKLIEALPVAEEKSENSVETVSVEPVQSQGFWERLFKRR
jgi:hypothetical protein